MFPDDRILGRANVLPEHGVGCPGRQWQHVVLSIPPVEITMESLESQLLVAVPQLSDANFYRTVVLMIQHDEQGAAGLVLNRPSEILLTDVCQELLGTSIESQERLYLGGPVEGPMLAIHQNDEFADDDITDSLYLASQRSTLEGLIHSPDTSAQYFTGYSGWGAGQLEAELDSGGWFVTPLSSDLLFGPHEDLWRAVTQRIGEQILTASLDGYQVPTAPELN